MTIGRPQIFKQIKGYQAGGIADLEVDTQPLLPPLGGSLPPAMPNNVLPLNNSLPAAPETPVLATETPVLATDTGSIDAQTQMLMKLLGPKDYETQRGMYEERFSSLIPARKPLNFYDLASELGAAILSRPQDEGAFTGIGVGFGNFQKRIAQADLEEKKQRDAFAMKAAELAMTDEREAEKFIKEYAVDILKNQNLNKEPNLITLTYDEVGPDGEFTGKKKTGSFDAVTQSAIILKLTTTQNGIKTEDLPDPAGESELSKSAGTDWIKTQAGIRDDARVANATLDMVQQGKVLASKIGKDNFGKGEEALMPIRQYVASFLPSGVIDRGKLSAQEALAQITIGFTLANVAKTKGAISNQEMKLLQNASPNLGQTYEGFTLALDLQERAARKIQEYAAEYQARVNELYRDNPQITGADMSREMDNFTTKWEQDGRDRFMTQDDKDRIELYNAEGQKLNLVSDYSTFSERMNNVLRKNARQTEQVTERRVRNSGGDNQTRNEVIQKIMIDPDLPTPEDKLKAIALFTEGN
jgi:hypothetical protein